MLVLGSAAFFALGIVLVLVGANQAEMARDLGMDLAASGLLGASLVLGLGAGVVAAGPLVDRLPRRPVFVAACALTAAALLTAEAGMSYARAVAHVAMIGAGCGVYDTLLNAAALDRWSERAASMLAVLHAAATAGAVAGPPLVAWTTAGTHWAASFHALGVVFAGLAACAAFVPLHANAAKAAHASSARESAESNAHAASAGDSGTSDWRASSAALAAASDAVAAPALFTPALVALAAAAFAYVGVETGLTLFAVPWATRALTLGEAAGRSAISSLWLGLLLGRLALVPWRAPPGAGLLAASGVTGGAVVWFASALARPELGLVLFLAGLALGPIYPVLISLAGRRLPQATGTAAALVGGAGALGGFALPALAGALGDAAGVAVAARALGVSCLVIAGAAAALRAPGRARAR